MRREKISKLCNKNISDIEKKKLARSVFEIFSSYASYLVYDDRVEQNWRRFNLKKLQNAQTC